MATSALQIKRPIVDEQRLGGLSERERYEVYERAGYNPFQITQLEWMVAESGQRRVGKGALQNVKVQLASAKCGAIRILESHTCERPFAYELEMDGTVQGYYSQFPCRHVLRTSEGGAKHVSNATLDFLVFHHNRVELVECKPERWLEKHQHPGEWEKNGEDWTCRPYERWANERDFPFRVWTPPEPVANYLRNLEAMYALTSYAKSGNRQARLDPTQQQCLEWVIRVLWNRGKVRTLKNLWFELEKVCNLHHAAIPSIETLYRYVRQEDATKKALATGGMRAYQAARPISDPAVRSGKAIGFGHTLHIDSSQFDNRCEPIVEIDFCGDKPWFYIGIDEATGLPMAHSLYFGKACTNGLALLLRNFVRRHGFLPLVIVLDRGSENDSLWLKAFCLENGITLLWAPTGGSRYNGQAECAIKQVNINVAHDLPGSTEPDMKGRKVDGKFKSRKTAKLAFMTICRAFEEYLYGDLPNTPGEGDCTPIERRDETVGRFGVMGTPQQLDDDFQIRTSVPVDFKGKATEKRGIRIGRGIFTSDELRILLRTSQPDEVRQDCEDSMLLFVRVRSQWLKAYHSGIFSTASLRPLEKLFEFLWSPHARRGRRMRKLDVDRSRYHRNQAHAIAVETGRSMPPAEMSERPEASSAEANNIAANSAVCWDN